jgi:hypothetical protein
MLAVRRRPARCVVARRWELEMTVSKRTAMKNFLDALMAVLAGNAIYFLLKPHLPAAIRHSLFREDWGLLVDFGICAVIFVAVKLAWRSG